MEENTNNPLGFKSVFTTAFKIFQRIFLPSLVGLFVLMIIITAIVLLLFPIVFKISFNDFSTMVMIDPEGLQNFVSSGGFFINSLLFSLLINCLIAPMGAGILQCCKFAFEKNPVPFKTVFSFYSSSYAVRIIGFILILKLIDAGISLLTGYMGVPSLSISFSFLLWILTVFCIPMIIFEDLSIKSAFQTSFRTVAPYIITIFLFLLLGGLLAVSGILLFGIGIIITMPFWYAMVFTLYFALRGVKGNLAF